MKLCRHPSLELNWLMRDLRHLPMPGVIYADQLPYAGLYCPPFDESSVVEGIELGPHQGVIVISQQESELTVECSLAHEFRHHWQFWNGWAYDGIGWDENSALDYRKSIARYFSESHSEMDALLYEIKRAPCDESLWRRSVAISAEHR